MAKITNKVSKAPTGTEATIAAGQPEPNAVAVVNDAAATPPGFSVPGGTNTPESSGAAAGPASAELVKPQGKDDTSTPVKGTEATNSQPAPGAEAAAPGGKAPNPTDASQGAAEPGAGNPAGSGDTPVFFGVDLARGPDVGAISLGGDFTALSDRYPLTYAFFSSWAENEPETMPTAIVVKSKTDGFRRGGIAHSASGTTFLPGEFTPEQLEAFLGETELTVEIVE